LKRLVSLFAFFLVLNSCTDEFKPVTFETSSIDKTYDADISVTYDKALGTSELSKRINFKVEEAIIETLSMPEKKTNLEAVLEDFNTEFVNFKKDYPEDTEPIWELHIETELSYQSQDIITIAISVYEFEGGAHGNDQIKFLNLDAKTGYILKQNDIIDNSQAFIDIAKAYFLKNLENREGNVKMEDYFFGEPFHLPENIGFSDDGLVLLYNVYEVASYAQGYTEFVIPFEEVEPYLKVN
jgi:hypothetical protein